MKKIVVIITSVIFISAALLGAYIYDATSKQLLTAVKCPPTITGINSIPFEMTYKAMVKKIPNGAKKLDLWMPYPQNVKGQTITNVSVKSPYPVKVNHESEYGNAIMYITVDNPKKDFEVIMKISAVREEILAARLVDQNIKQFENSGNFDIYFRQDRVGQITPLIKGLAGKITKSKTTTIEKAQAIYDYIMGTYDYDFDKKSLPKERGYLPHVCSVLKGRCTELNTLFAALMRAERIPVRYVNGFNFKNVPEGKIDGYCCRSEFFVSGYGWIPVDPASGKKFPEDAKFYFGNIDENRLELVAGRDLKLAPPQKGPRLNVFIYPYAEIDGKIFEVDKEISWKNEL